MTIRAARLLDTAFATYEAVSDALDDTNLLDPLWPVLNQAADLVKSLLPATYNYPATDTDTTELVWKLTVEWGEVLTFEQVNELTDAFYDFKGLAALNGQKFFGSASSPVYGVESIVGISTAGPVR